MKYLLMFIVVLSAACDSKKKIAPGTNAQKQELPDDPEIPPNPPGQLPPVDWAQPPVGCVEEMVPTVAPKPCPDYTNVVDIFKEWPSGYPEVDIEYWRSRKRGIDYCRAQEVLKREGEKPGSYKSSQVELSWMRFHAVNRSSEKISKVYEVSRRFEIPAQILVGALHQESLFSDLYISADGENFSCGIGQINLQEWCVWANNLPANKKIELGWPSATVNCAQVQTTFVKPFYDLARAKSPSLPEYLMSDVLYKDITLDDVKAAWNSIGDEEKVRRFQITKSFLNSCQEPLLGIEVKATALKRIFDRNLPAGFKAIDTYESGKKFDRNCQEEGVQQFYPLHRGWVMSVGIYNAGPRAVDAFAYYYKLNKNDLSNSAKMSSYTPREYIESFYWSGAYRPATDKIHFVDLNGREVAWTWFKPCVLQRHIARIMQHVTLPKAPLIADTLEGSFGCAKSQFDPTTGGLIKSGVPPMRQISSGQK